MCIGSYKCPKCDTWYWDFPFFRCKCGYAFLATASEMGIDKNTVFINEELPAIPQEIADYWQKHMEEYDGKICNANICNEIWQKICATSNT